MLWLTMHAFADIGDVAKDGLLVSFPHELRWRECVSLAGGVQECGVRSVKLSVEALE